MSQPSASQRPPTPRWVKIFGALGLVIVVLLVLKLTGVVGEGHGPGRHLGMSLERDVVGAPADAAQATRTINVTTLDSLAFDPATIGVLAGETVTFAVTNTGKIIHEFTVGDAAMQQEHAQKMAHAPDGMSHDTPNSVRVDAGETGRITWRFGDAGTLEYACHQSGHYGAGMRGIIKVS